MQFVRIIKNNNEEELLKATAVTVNFDKQTVSVWRPAQYWDVIPMQDVYVVSTFDADEDYRDMRED